MLKVAVTGGIGSGKSMVCMVFEKLGIPVFHADEVAKQLMNSNQSIREELTTLFGADIYQRNGAIHRKKLAGIIFNNEIALQKINNIIHPAVYNEFNAWAEKQNAPYVIQETAIIFENGHTERFDKIVTVIAPVELRLMRSMKRDGATREMIEERMKNQLPDEFKMRHSDYVIVNDDKEMVLPQILKIHNRLI